MNSWLSRNSIALLRWTVGLVVLLQSSWLAFAPSAAHSFSKSGFPAWVRPMISGPEILAALLFLIPATNLVGSYFLLVIFALATLIHALHGDLPTGVNLLIYAAAVLVCMAHREKVRSAPKQEP
ncbi:MAG TPA: DoxX family protein [Candidatus Acidoferrales bacterium]|nr:DoxX family protein [Candidatus Acidoferrales bacterium]